MPAIQIRGHILESDYLHAQHLHMRARRALSVMGIVLIFLGLALSILNVLSWMDGSKSANDAMMLPALIALVLGYIYAYLPWSYRRIYRKQPSLHEPVDIEWGDGGLAYDTEHNKGEIPWRLFTKWREGRRTFLIYSAPNLFHIVPKRLLEGNGEEQLRTLLVNKLGQAA